MIFLYVLLISYEDISKKQLEKKLRGRKWKKVDFL